MTSCWNVLCHSSNFESISCLSSMSSWYCFLARLASSFFTASSCRRISSCLSFDSICFSSSSVMLICSYSFDDCSSSFAFLIYTRLIKNSPINRLTSSFCRVSSLKFRISLSLPISVSLRRSMVYSSSVVFTSKWLMRWFAACSSSYVI